MITPSTIYMLLCIGIVLLIVCLVWLAVLAKPDGWKLSYLWKPQPGLRRTTNPVTAAKKFAAAEAAHE